MHDNYSTLFSFRSLIQTILFFTMVHGFKASSTKNVELLDLSSHINTKLIFKPEGPTHENTSSLEPVLFEKLHNIKLSCSVLRISTFFNFALTKNCITTFASVCMGFSRQPNTSVSKLVDDNDHKSYDIKQRVLTYSTLLKLCTDKLTDCRSQINQLTTQVNCILTTLDQPKRYQP